MSSVPEGEVRRPSDPDTLYAARRGPRFELVKEELDVFQELQEAVRRHCPPGASDEEIAAMWELVREDPEIAALRDRLQELIAANDESALLALAERAREEEDAEG